MSIQVKTFNSEELKKAIKESPKIVQEYIEAQKRVITGWEDINKKAIAKIRELSKRLKIEDEC